MMVFSTSTSPPRRFRHWVKLALRLVTRRAKKDDQVDQRREKRADRHPREGQLPARRRRCRGVHHSLRRDPTGCPDHLRACPSRQRAASVTGLPRSAGGRGTIRPGQAAHGEDSDMWASDLMQPVILAKWGRPCSPARIHALEDCSHGPLQSPLGSGQARPDRKCL